jgi:hypothetical protein
MRGRDEEKRGDELALVRAFLKRDGWEVLHAESAVPPKPDVLARVRKGAEELCLGVEITELGDEEEHALQAEWSEICAAVGKRASECPELSRVGACLVPTEERPPKSARSAIVDELVSVIKSAISSAGVADCITIVLGPFGPEYPHLKRHLKRLYLHPRSPKRTWEVSKGGWAGGYAGVWGSVSARVEKKATEVQGKGYDRRGLDQVWLILCAAGPTGKSRSVANIIAPRSLTEEDPEPPDEVRRTCRDSGFQRVVLWNAGPGEITDLI